jgi:hypothetical protein
MFLLRVAFDIQCLLSFHMNFRINFPISVMNGIGILFLSLALLLWLGIPVLY